MVQREMKSTLEELKKIMSGIEGSFIIDETGEVMFHDLPEDMEKNAGRISKLFYYVVSVMKASKVFDRVIIDSDARKFIAMLARERILVVIADRDVNLPLLKLVSNIAVSKLKEDQVAPSPKRKMNGEKINEICNIYDELFTAAANRLKEIFGSDAAQMFEKNLSDVREGHPKLLSGVGFAPDGRPKMARLKLNSNDVTEEELKSGLEDLLVSMLETMKDTAGPVIADKSINEIIKIKEENKGVI